MAATRVVGQHRRAVELCDLALNRALSPALTCSFLLERAAALIALGEHERAERDSRCALGHATSAKAHELLAVCLGNRGEVQGALRHFEAALALEPSRIECKTEYASLLSRAGSHARALEVAHSAFEAARSSTISPYVRADDQRASERAQRALLRVLAAAGRHEQLAELATGELERAPGDIELWLALARSLVALGESRRAVRAFRRALALAPEQADVHCGLAMELLRGGALAEGFAHHEYRQRGAGIRNRLAVPAWRGEPVEGRHLLVWGEQGLGDQLQFARFLPMLHELGARVSFFPAPPLRRLLESANTQAVVEDGHPGFAAADYQVLLLSLPHLLRLGSRALEVPPLALRAEPERVERWRQRLGSGRKIALAWQGNPRYGGEPGRSMPFSRFQPLFAHSVGTEFISLQKGDGIEQLRQGDGPVRDLSRDLDVDGHAFLDSLAILQLVELFITTDTALAHLAGSAGVRTWLLLNHLPDWRWGIQTERSGWYSSLRLFRQTRPGDWDGVIERVQHALAKLERRDS